MKPTLYLASGSSRRREILENLGYRVLRLNADIEETPQPKESASDYVARMAIEKNKAALSTWHATHTEIPAFPILTADTTVALGGQILGKPDNATHAEEMLTALSGSTHQVLTAICVYFNGQRQSYTQTSHVTFKTLSPEEIRAYIASGEPLDKAGAYGIQGVGGVFVDHLEGSFTGVMGLPACETASLLRQMGYVAPPF
ncbi:MAG: nucleoside triphosphate pyrophosphatase [Neisseria sp.]|uniref:Maf family protein n=1 Tax=Neisseria sp. TaxID=192066 RepID=UPI0026DCB780|nr:nucleoside triphosphate pyrophosphatase [Neisseria sp.]MDO4640900.1 nucleoside triphosphate pyrophosphatase [Neisseria sp.]